MKTLVPAWNRGPSKLAESGSGKASSDAGERGLYFGALEAWRQLTSMRTALIPLFLLRSARRPARSLPQ